MSVKDRTLVTTTDAERQVVTPPTLQDKINQTVAKYPRYVDVQYILRIFVIRHEEISCV